MWLVFAGVAAAFGVYLLTFLDGAERRLPGRIWPAFQRARFWRIVADYLFGSVKLTIEDPQKLRSVKQGILAVAPHGIVSFNHGLYFTDCCGFLTETWLVDRRDLGASVLFFIPFWRDVMLWLGLVDASKKTASAVLKSGRSLFVYPGGEAEQMRTKPGHHIAYWQSRKGFVRLAVEFGVPVIPSYVFGENDLYNNVPLFYGVRMWICSKFKIAIPFVYGRMWCPLLPKKVPQLGVVGPPIEVPMLDPTDPEFEKVVDETHEKVLKELAALFDRHKEAYGCPEARLEIIGGADAKKSQ